MNMRRFIILCLLLFASLAAQARSYRAEDIPNVQRADRTRYVSNPDGILSPGAVARIDSVCGALRDRAIAQVAVVAVDDIAGGDVFDFAVDLFTQWGVGRAENDNGLGILLVRDRREIRFVTGGGLEGVLPDAVCKRIQLKYMLPAFREGDYSRGMVAGVEAAAQLLEGSELDLGGTDTADGELPSWAVFLIVVGFVVLPLGVVMLGYYARKRCPKCHKPTLRQQSNRILQVTPSYRLVEYTYVCSNCGAVVKRRAKNLRDDNFGGGGGTIIGGFGGFGGFGGGSRGGFGGGFGGFGGSARQANPNAPRKGQDIRVRITLSFDEAVHGCKKNITITRQQECTECHGSGCAAGSSPETCPDCGGRGFVIRQQRTPFGVMQTQQPCSRCGGKGKLVKNPCKVCHGSGKTAARKTLEVSIPMGIDDDQSFALRGMGDAGANGGPAGDVIVMVTVRPSEVFQRDGYDVYVIVPITYSQAVLGDSITVPSIDGKVEVTVPEGTQSGTTFRLRGKGIQYLNGRGRGDMYVRCEVEIPKKLSKTQRDALKKFEGTLKEENYEKRKGFFKKLKDMFQ